MTPKLAANDFHVGWICAIRIEYTAACTMLDEEYLDVPPVSRGDFNSYTCGRIGKHQVAIACLPHGRYGLSSAASVAKDMMRSFPNICIGLMVGIGGGAPSEQNDIRLGDVVVGTPVGRSNGVVPYELGKAIQGQEFKYNQSLNAPPHVLLSAIQTLRQRQDRERINLTFHVDKTVDKSTRLRKLFKRPNPQTDRLFRPDFTHRDESRSCEGFCDLQPNHMLERPSRGDWDTVRTHYGLIASADKLMRDAHARDRLVRTENVKCFEMESAGLDQFPCIVIRGICDYSDTHKDDVWHGYAAAIAAAYAKELLTIVPRFNFDEAMSDFTQQMHHAIKSESRSLRMAFQQGVDATKIQMTETVHDVHSKSMDRAQRNEFLQSLKFPEMNLRMNEIKRSSDKTFEWIFDQSHSRPPNTLIGWFQSERGIFWIGGKPGSGKSTLMKFLLQKLSGDKTLKDSLSGGEKPIIMRYFFWLYGSPRQRGFKGMLSSMLSQLLYANEHQLMQLLEDPDLASKRTQADWAEEELSKMLTQCIAERPRKYWILVDALDEITKDDQPEVLEFLEVLSQAGRVKIAVSSRPEPIFRRFFETTPQLKLEDLTQGDMRSFIEVSFEKYLGGSLEATSTLQKVRLCLMPEILRKANGVFLWVHLALKSITTGLIGGDEMDELRTRLDALPSDLAKLYDHMWKRADHTLDSYRHDAALCLRLLLVHESCGRYSPLTIPRLMLASNSELRRTYLTSDHKFRLSAFVQQCQIFMHKVLVRGAGLIEAIDIDPSDVSWFSLGLGFDDLFENAPERRCFLLQARSVHRSALEFLRGSEEGQKILSYSAVDQSECRHRLDEAQLLTLRFGLLHFGSRPVQNLERKIQCYHGSKTRLRALEQMAVVCREVYLRQFQLCDVDDWYYALHISRSRLSYLGNIQAGWDGVLARNACLPYFLELRQSSTRSFNKSYLSSLLSYALSANEFIEEQTKMVHWLLEQGANPDAPCAIVSWPFVLWISPFQWYLVGGFSRGSTTAGVWQEGSRRLVQRLITSGASMSRKTLCVFSWTRTVDDQESFVLTLPFHPMPYNSMLVEINIAGLLRIIPTGPRGQGIVDHSPACQPYAKVLCFADPKSDGSVGVQQVSLNVHSDALLEKFYRGLESTLQVRMGDMGGQQKHYDDIVSYIRSLPRGELLDPFDILREYGVLTEFKPSDIPLVKPFENNH